MSLRSEMKANSSSVLKTLSPEMRKALKPFIKEYFSLCCGEKSDIHIRVEYPGQLPPNGWDYFIKVKFIWEDDNFAKYELPKSYNLGSFVVEELVEKSPQFQAFQARIDKFLSETNRIGREQFDEEDALWSAYFWVIN